MKWKIIGLILLSAIVYSANSWNTSVYILDEAKNAGCAMEMYQQDEWIVPTFNGALRTDKPPLHYYFMKTAFGVLGINPFSARVFSSCMGVLTVVIVFLFARKMCNERVAFYASLILISSLQLAIQFHLAVPDPYFIFFLTCGWLSFIYAFTAGKQKFYYLFYLAVALATLAKGPVAVVFTALLLVIFLVIQRKFSWRFLRQVKFFQGSLLFLLVVLPWYVAVGMETNGEWSRQFFLKHNVGRFTTPMEGHGGFPLASVVIAILALMPFSFFFPQAIRVVWKERKQNPFLEFCLLAMSIVIVFFAFSRTILPSYPEPALPFFAILLGYFFDLVQKYAAIGSFNLRINAAVYFVIALLLPVGVSSALRAESNLRDLSSLAGYFVILSIGACLALVFIWLEKVHAAIVGYATASILFLIVFFFVVFPKVDQQNPITQSLFVIKDSSIPIVAYKDFNPAYVFALQRTIKRFESANELEQAIALDPKMYLITQKKYLPELSRFGFVVLYEGKDLFEKPTTIILRK